MNIVGIQIISLKNYKRLVEYQSVMTQLGVKYNQLEGFKDIDPQDNVHVQTEHFAKYANSEDSYFKKLNKSIQSKQAVSSGAGNSIENTHMAQYNEQRIARMLLQEKLTSLELSKKKAPKPRTKTSRRSSK